MDLIKVLVKYRIFSVLNCIFAFTMLFKRFSALFFATLILVNSIGLMMKTHSCFKSICIEKRGIGLFDFGKKTSCCSEIKRSEISQEKNNINASNCCKSEVKYIKSSYKDLLEVEKNEIKFSSELQNIPSLQVHFSASQFSNFFVISNSYK